MFLQKNVINTLEIQSHLEWSESDDLEYKSAKGGLPKSLWETYSAMANTQGGVILLGVENDGTITGVNDLPKIKKTFWDTINNRSKVNINLLIESDVKEIKYSKGMILAIRIPRATRYQRPVFVGLNPLTGTFRRNFEGDYHCSEKEVGRMLSDRGEESADGKILENYTFLDLDSQSLQQYRNRFASHNPAHPWLNENDKSLLLKLGGWRVCRETNREGPTLAGLLMFGKEVALHEMLPGYQVDYHEILSDDPSVRWSDRFTIDGTWAGNLFQFYVRNVVSLSRDLKLPFQIGEDLFRKGETVVHEAVREAFVNALIHADYYGEGGVVIRKYKDRFEFENPGSLLISVDQLFRGGVSECRNKTLQKMFFMLGAAEKAGSGVDKILKGWSSQHWCQPNIKEQPQPNRVIWTLPMISLIPQDSNEHLEQLFRPKFYELSELEVQILVTAEMEKGVDNGRIRQFTQTHSSDLTQILQSLVTKGFLIQKGQKRGARYVLPSHVDSFYEENLVHKEENLVHKEESLVHKEEENIVQNEDLLKIAAFARESKRLMPKEIELIIWQLCEGRYLSKSQISNLIQRNPGSLRSRFLTKMVENGLLKLRYPDKPNHNAQAYTSDPLLSPAE